MGRHLFGSWSFRTLCGSSLAVFLAAVCALGFSLWRDRSDDIRDAVRDARNVGIVLSGQIGRSIQAVDIVLKEVQWRIDSLDLLGADGSVSASGSVGLRHILQIYLKHLPQAELLSVADERGQIIASTAGGPTLDINVGDREYFRELAANGDKLLSISEPIRSRIDGEPAIIFARRINGPNGVFLGAVGISMNLRYFEGIYSDVTSLQDQTFSLIRTDGTVYVRYPDQQIRAGEKIPQAWPFHAVVRNGGGSYRSPGMFDQTVRWIAVNPLKEYPLVVAIAIPEAVILRSWRTHVIVMGAGAMVFLACGLVLLFIMARQYADLSRSEASLAEKSAALEQEHARLLASEAALRTQNQRFDAALNNMSQALAMFDSEARIVVCNDHYRKLYDLAADQVTPGRSLRDIVSSCQWFDHRGSPDAIVAEIMESATQPGSNLHEFTRMDGRVISVMNCRMNDGGWVSTHEDVTDRRAVDAKIKFLAHNDPLTGIANRSEFVEQIDKARQRLQANGDPFSVLVLDLDRFKHVNDSLGHAAGDTLLKAVTRRLQQALRSTDILARIGGDEFAIIKTPPRDFDPAGVSSSDMREGAIVLAGRIIDLLAEPYDIDGQKLVIGVSIGIAMAPGDAVEPDELMKKADLALYRVKADGRNGYAFFAPEMAVAADERHRLEIDLREGLERDEFEIHYQPLIDVATGRACCMEALVRWNHPTFGVVAPDRFISVAEDIGLITMLGEWIVQTACTEAASWPPDVKVAINISPVQFRKTNLLDVILCALVESGLPPERLEIEITERVLLEKEASHLSTLHQLRNLGIAVALDDFGTGYSSLGYLKMFPFDKIKIDRGFTSEILERPDCAAIVRAVVSLGRSLDIVTAAEGVETPDQLRALRTAGVSQAQGFLFGHPAPARALRFDEVAVAAPMPPESIRRLEPIADDLSWTPLAQRPTGNHDAGLGEG